MSVPVSLTGPVRMKPSSPQTANWVSSTARPMMAGPVAGDPAGMRSKAWIAEDINHGGVISNSRLTLAFGADGKV
ncbi:MAG: hypothetical protein GC196_07930 [Hyphomonas sp.]|nr:hypothetical protein [Hyphomonas sp.]